MASQRTVPHGLAVEHLTSLAALTKLEDEWRGLLESQNDATPFQHPDWILAWARHFVPNAIWAWSFHSLDGRLVGLVPSFRYERDGLRIVSMMGGGDSDWHDVIAFREFRSDIGRAFFAALERRRDQWDRCELEQLPETSALLQTALPVGLVEESRTPHAPCPVLALPERGASMTASIPGHQLARYRKYRRRVERLGELRLVRASERDAQRHFETFLRLHRARWQVREDTGDAPVFEHRNFHSEVVGRMAARGSLRLYLLRSGTRDIAALYGFMSAKTLHCYAQGLDPEFAKLGPGMLLVGAVIEDAFAEGAAAVDFLRGEEPYKLQWGAKSQPTYRRVVKPLSSPSR